MNNVPTLSASKTGCPVHPTQLGVVFTEPDRCVLEIQGCESFHISCGEALVVLGNNFLKCH
jgi:hypothetical protein